MYSRNISIAFILFAVLLVACDAQRTSASRARTLASVGLPFPEFSGTTLEGSTVDNGIFRNKVTLVSAWRIGCEWSLVEIAEYNHLYDSIRDPRFQMISMAPQDRNDLRGHYDKYGSADIGGEDRVMPVVPHYPVVPMCVEGSTSAAAPGDGRCTALEELVGAEMYPITFVVGPDGVIRHRHDGLMVDPETLKPDLSEFKRELDSLLTVL